MRALRFCVNLFTHKAQEGGTRGTRSFWDAYPHLSAASAFHYLPLWLMESEVQSLNFTCYEIKTAMRKIVVLSMISLDGVLQGPGSPEEDPSDGFRYGGWMAPYDDDVYDLVVQKELEPADYLLGRKTFKIWENYWPAHAEFWPGINEGTKYVLSNTLSTTDWKNTVFLKNLDDIKKLKDQSANDQGLEGRDIQVWGSGELIQLLLQNDLVDELRLKIHPLTLGSGKKLFDGGAIPAAFSLMETLVTPSGVIIANYKRAGNVETGTMGV